MNTIISLAYIKHICHILAELFNKCLQESCFPDCWKVSSVVPVFKNVGKRSTAKNYCAVGLLSVVSKVCLQKLVNCRIVDHLDRCGLFSDFQYGFRSSRSTADLLTVVCDRIARAFYRSGATQAVALMELQVRYLALFLLLSVIDGFEWFWMESLHKNIQLMLRFLKAPFLVLHIFYYTLMTFLMMLFAILLSKLMMLISDLWQQLELVSELESDLLDTVNWGKKWLVDFIAWKNQLVLFDRSNNNGSDVKMDGSVLEEKMLGLTF